MCWKTKKNKISQLSRGIQVNTLLMKNRGVLAISALFSDHYCFRDFCTVNHGNPTPAFQTIKINEQIK